MFTDSVRPVEVFFLLAQSRFGEFLLALAQEYTVSVKPCFSLLHFLWRDGKLSIRDSASTIAISENNCGIITNGLKETTLVYL